jgi:hypothetical protein
MSQKLSNTSSEIQILDFRAKIEELKAYFQNIQDKTAAFEAQLRAHLVSEIVEEHELALLYKQQKLAKKDKRFQQKMKGKNFQAKESLVVAKQEVGQHSSQANIDESQLRKRLYREAMVLIHPDKFSLQGEMEELASELTAKLIVLYKDGSLADLQALHHQIVNKPNAAKEVSLAGMVDINYFEQEMERLQAAISKAENKHTYKVLTTYEEPMRFLDELKAYYADRIFKLKKRTRS